MKKYLKFLFLFPLLYLIVLYLRNKGHSLSTSASDVRPSPLVHEGIFPNFYEIVKKYGNYPVQNDRPCAVSPLNYKDFFYKFAPSLKLAKDELNFNVPLTWLLAHAYIETGAGNSSLVCYNNFTGVKEYTNKDKYVLRWTWEFYKNMTIKQAQDTYNKYAAAMKNKGFHGIRAFGFFYDESEKGTWIYCNEPFRKDNTIKDGFVHYISLLQRRYKHDLSSPYNWAKGIALQGYGGANADKYASALQKHVENFDKLF